jgi:hypothetical protein
MALALLIFLFSFVQAYAEEQGAVRIQGTVMALQLQKNMVIVAEKECVWDSKTLFHDEKGSSAKAGLLKKDGWVYIVGVKQKNKPILIQKLYFLSKYIQPEERHRYPFMQ